MFNLFPGILAFHKKKQKKKLTTKIDDMGVILVVIFLGERPGSLYVIFYLSGYGLHTSNKYIFGKQRQSLVLLKSLASFLSDKY